MREFILYLMRSLSCDGPVARRDSTDRTVSSPSVAGVWSSSRKDDEEAPRGFSAHRRESPRPIDYMKGQHRQCGFWRGPRGDGVYRRHRCDHRRLEARPPWPLSAENSRTRCKLQERVGLYARAVPGMHRAGSGERGGGSYGRRAVAAAKGAAMQISGAGKGLKLSLRCVGSSSVQYFSATHKRGTYLPMGNGTVRNIAGRHGTRALAGLSRCQSPTRARWRSQDVLLLA